MNVLSLFDGISCGQIALNRANIKYDNYFASEIDKHAIKVTQFNYPNTIQLGDVTKIQGKDLPKIDLLIGGSPCQGFSSAGKGLNFNDPRSKLFFEYVRLLKETNPKHFLLENVRMKKEYQDVISENLKVQPLLINSALVSAQNRQRLYWSNISNITQPEDKNIQLSDILEIKNTNVLGCAKRTFPRYPTGQKRKKKLELRNDNKSNCLTSIQTDSLVYIKNPQKYLPKEILSKYIDPYNQKNIFTNKSTSLRTNFSNGNMWINDEGWRKLTILECERLQTIPDNYTQIIPNTYRYKCLGNCWTVDVIVHILKNIK